MCIDFLRQISRCDIEECLMNIKIMNTIISSPFETARTTAGQVTPLSRRKGCLNERHVCLQDPQEQRLTARLFIL